jgi:hypothetical protein
MQVFIKNISYSRALACRFGRHPYSGVGCDIFDQKSALLDAEDFWIERSARLFPASIRSFSL